MGPCRWRAALVAVLLGLVLEPALGGDDPATEKTFLADVEKARATLAAGKPAEGVTLLKATLQRHEGRDYARAKRVDLEDLVRRLVFAVEVPAPQPKDVVKGKIVSYSSNPSRVKIVYTAKEHDFQPMGEMLAHPARFTGAFSIEIHGKDYPKDTNLSPRVLVGMVENPKTDRRESWQVSFGCAPYDRGSSSVWLPARISHRDGEKSEILDEKEISPAKPGADFRLEVNVASTRIIASLNGSKMLAAAKSNDVFGYVSFECPKWTTVYLEGAVEPSWIQGQIDAIVQKNLASFEKRFDVKQHLPEWLFQAGAAPATATTPDGAGDFPEVPPALLLEVAAIDKRLDEDDNAGALTAIEALKKRGASDALLGYLSARANMGLHKLTAALANLDQTLSATPALAAAHLMRGVVLYRLGRNAEAETAFRAAVAARPAYSESAAMYLLLADRAEAARSITEDAARRGQRSQMLDVLGRVLVKALRGPEWPKVFEFKSANYHVLSDIDQETCKQAAQVLEESLASYKSNLQGMKRGPPRLFRVFLFRGRAGFGAYYEDVSLFGRGAPENAAGLYSPMLKQLLIWNLPSRDEMMRTVRHEGFHQYLDRLLPEAPTWFNEGLAVYYENLERVAGQVRYGVVHADYVEALQKKGLMPLEAFFAMPHKKFYEDPTRNYGQAWLLCHMLRHGTPQHKELLKALLLKLETEPAYEAVQAVFAASMLPRLEADLKRYLDTMAKDR